MGRRLQLVTRSASAAERDDVTAGALDSQPQRNFYAIPSLCALLKANSSFTIGRTVDTECGKCGILRRPPVAIGSRS